MARHRTEPDGSAPQSGERRSLLSLASSALMGGALVAAYGTLAAFMARFLYPARPPRTGWMFVTEISRLSPGGSLTWRTPGGATVAVARQGEGAGVENFIALSSTCPHLGCQVHWEPQNDRFFCPCHNGTFDPSGKGTGGPPGEAGQSLPRYPLKVEKGLLFIEVPVERLAAGGAGEVLEGAFAPPGPGHDPCLYRGGRRS